MDIRQLSVRYQTDQDRILVCINTSNGDEVQMWLTQRIALRFWPLINRVVIDHFAIPVDTQAGRSGVWPDPVDMDFVPKAQCPMYLN